MRRIKNVIKLILPPVFILFFNFLNNYRYGWSGKYSSWSEAQNASIGYDAQHILDTVKNSLMKVKCGEAVYERDSVLFDEIQFNWPLLSGLMYAAGKSNGRLHVMDFGGSLGSTYFQNRGYLEKIDDLKWSIVEQAHFVDAGKKDFETETLKFYSDINHCISDTKPNVLLLSSVVQYIEDPYSLLEILLNSDFDLIILDRTPFVKKGSDTIKLQRVDPSIYDASYPCWFFEHQAFMRFFEERGYSVRGSFKALDGSGFGYQFLGCFFENKVRNRD